MLPHEKRDQRQFNRGKQPRRRKDFLLLWLLHNQPGRTMKPTSENLTEREEELSETDTDTEDVAGAESETTAHPDSFWTETKGVKVRLTE